VKSGTAAREAKGGRCHLDVEDDKKNWVGEPNARLGRNTDWVSEKYD
jgi:hypothetical protein